MKVLKRCQNCGGRAYLHPDQDNGGKAPDLNTSWRIDCSKCGFGTTIGSKETVEKIWSET